MAHVMSLSTVVKSFQNLNLIQSKRYPTAMAMSVPRSLKMTSFQENAEEAAAAERSLPVRLRPLGIHRGTRAAYAR